MNDDVVAKRKKYLDLFFNEGENVIYSEDTYIRDSTLYSEWMHKGVGYTSYKKNGELKRAAIVQNFFSINPYKKGGTRGCENVSDPRNFLFEIDYILKKRNDTAVYSDPFEIVVISKKYQLDFWKMMIKEHRFPASAMLDSGNKSIHLCMCRDNGDYDFIEGNESKTVKYKKVWKKISLRIKDLFKDFLEREDLVAFSSKESKEECVIDWENDDEFTCDSQCGETSRFTRFPEVVRKDNKKYQQVIACGKRINDEVLFNFLKSCREPKKEKKKTLKQNPKHINTSLFVSSTYNRDEFLSVCPKHLHDKIKQIRKYPASPGRHEKLRGFYLSLFGAFSEMDCDYALSLCEDMIYPKLLEAGYDKNRLYNNTLISTWEYIHGK